MSATFDVVVTGHAFTSMEIERRILQGIGHLTETFPKSKDELIDVVRNADAVVNQKSWIDAEVIAHMTRCKIIVHYGIGTDKIDGVAAAAKGIYVCNVPDYCVEEVATHAIAMLLAFERQIAMQSARLRDGQWTFSKPGDSHRLKGRSFGLLGFGRIARRVAQLAAAFGLKVIVHDPMVPHEAIEAAGARAVAFDDLLSADYVSIHCPLTPATRGIFGKEVLSKISPESVLINVSRGPIIVEADLLSALKKKQIRGAILDVFEKEPTNPANPLLKFDNVLATPHTAWFSDEALDQLKSDVANEVRRVLEGKKPLNCVNMS